MIRGLRIITNKKWTRSGAAGFRRVPGTVIIKSQARPIIARRPGFSGSARLTTFAGAPHRRDDAAAAPGRAIWTASFCR